MAIQMYLIQPRDGSDDRARERIADQIAVRQGFVLMKTSVGALIAALDEAHVAVVKAHRDVDFVGGITLDPNGSAATKLQHLFAHNIAQQLAGRTNANSGTIERSDLTGSLYPSGYRPIRDPSGQRQDTGAGALEMPDPDSGPWNYRFR